MAVFQEVDGGLECRFMGEMIRVTPWGPDAVRVRARPGRGLVAPHVDALLPAPAGRAEIEIGADRASLTHGRIRAEITLTERYGADIKCEAVIRFLRADTGEELLAETRSHFAGPRTRSFKALASGSWRLEAQFRAYEDESLWGMGQPQHGAMDLKGVSTTLLQQNAHAVIPFVVSSRGYGFLWNNPATGRAEFARNVTRWTAEATGGLDYWITAGDSPAEILRSYIRATGHSPDVPDWVLGFWQCKLRYRNQEELLSVAREYKRRALPLSCIVIDFFAWTRQGEWRFDPKDWPDPEAMVAELAELGVEVMVSIWPTVSASSIHYRQMTEEGLLLGTERGIPAIIPFPDKDPFGAGFFTYYDAFNPAARAFHWDIVRQNYLDKGIRHFWLDACEPEMRPAHPENIRTALGNGAEMLCAYPLVHEAGYRQGLTRAGAADGVLLCRSAWAGSQRHGVILWSGDVWSDWAWFRAQIPAGLHAGMAGMGWWTTDIGGFYDGHGGSAAFRDLLVRWFEFGVFSPISRLHGFRVPDDIPPPAPGEPVTYGQDTFNIFTDTGGSNEVWSFGPEVETVLVELLGLRERLRPYLETVFATYAATGDPVMAPLFYHHPGQRDLFDRADAYMLGPDMLVAPVLEAGATARSVALPEGQDWVHAWTGIAYSGGTTADIDAPWGRIPVFIRKDRAEALLPIFEGTVP
ncbi:MAG: glycoside hydrolase family 31 protein [Roseicyclus sp.]|nr:glycoside hydrolase family 31 protein [Roseicyclus sp.]MBO6623802.1 glycoside hydrolase family 31 protein [Roseicyclus sp.]MBO6922239.1 glycoside hydrolase family 31 protein [Roseicyclus sp.]